MHCASGEVGQVNGSGGSHIIPPLRMSSKILRYPTSRVLAIHSSSPTSRLARKRSGNNIGTRTTSDGLREDYQPCSRLETVSIRCQFDWPAQERYRLQCP